MAITFQNIPNTIRTPGAYTEIDNSRALQGLYPNPHKALIIAQRMSTGTKPAEALVAITRDNLADGYFGAGSILARMCNNFKVNNPNTELYALPLSYTAGTIKASAHANFSVAMAAATANYDDNLCLMINGTYIPITITSAMSGQAIASQVLTTVNTSTYSTLGVYVSTIVGGSCVFLAMQSGSCGNYFDVRLNYYNYQSNPRGFSRDLSTMVFAGGDANPSLADAWAVIDDQQFQYIIQPYTDATSLISIEGELEDRFGPLIDLQGHGFTAAKGTQASCTTLGNARNSPFNTIMGVYDSPTPPEIWATALGAVSANALNQDPARPLHTLKLKGIMPPPVSTRFTRSERDTLLYDGIATYIVDTGGNVLIERCITTYQANGLGIPDPSYLDIETLATLNEIRYQYKSRMVSSFIAPRFKLVDDGNPIQPGSYTVSPNVIKSEIIALFTTLRDAGLIENLDDFIINLVVERDTTDTSRINVLLPPDITNQFRILGTLIQFLL